MKSRPIIMNKKDVSAILKNLKTQFRRPVNPQPIITEKGQHRYSSPPKFPSRWIFFPSEASFREGMVELCPWGTIGDELWVRETYQYHDWTEDGDPFIKYAADESVLLRFPSNEVESERAGEIWMELSDRKNFAIHNRACDQRWRSPFFMPKWASRITLEITGVKVERLCEITPKDCKAEGIENRIAFVVLWDEIYVKKPEFQYDPWVWVIEFKRKT